MEFVNTSDGSKTLFQEKVGEHYHSKHGAVVESKHVFLTAGLQYYIDRSQKDEVSVLEVGFGTGLNFLIAADWCTQSAIKLNYVGVETEPLPLALLRQSGYNAYVADRIWDGFLAGYQRALSEAVQLDDLVRYRVAYTPILAYAESEKFDVVFFDAFAEIHQPEMWSMETLAHVADLLNPGGVFVTYAITGNLKRAMRSLGFAIEKVPGAPGKREMMRAVKRAVEET